MTEYGAGPVLTQNFDFNIISSGDIETASGPTELEKDIAFNVAAVINEEGLGNQFGETQRNNLRVLIGSTISDDPRITNINRLTIEQDEDNVSRININADTTAGEGPFDAVIPV